MNKWIVVACVGMLGAVCVATGVKRAAAPAAGPISKPPAQPMGKLMVHEWGTFTGFAGSDGVHLPFNVNIGSDLPAFVMNRKTHAEQHDPKLRLQLAFIKGGGAPALQRMETPVLYFYADAPGEVEVRVDFPQGLLTEFYPPVRGMGPKYGAAFGEFAAPDPVAPSTPGGSPQTRPAKAEVAESYLDWGRVRIVPHPAGDEGKLVPAVTTAGHYAFARDTDAALVQYAEPGGARHEEKFLFYRGLGNFTLPVSLIAEGGDHFELRNASASPIHAAFLMQVDKTADGSTPQSVRFARFDNVAGNQKLTLPPASARQEDLSAAIVNSLVADGLFEKEAQAMVHTWKSTWLDEAGTRILYIVPRPVTDAMLPLRIRPAPEQTVRVLVGRIDVMTPEQESQIRSMLLTADATGNVSNDDAQMLTGLGRFYMPALERMSKLAGEAGPRQVSRLRQALSRPVAERK